MTRRATADVWLTTDQAAGHLKIARQTLHRLRAESEIAGIPAPCVDLAALGSTARSLLRWEAAKLNSWAAELGEWLRLKSERGATRASAGSTRTGAGAAAPRPTSAPPARSRPPSSAHSRSAKSRFLTLAGKT